MKDSHLNFQPIQSDSEPPKAGGFPMLFASNSEVAEDVIIAVDLLSDVLASRELRYHRKLVAGGVGGVVAVVDGNMRKKNFD
jgi:hypothetical protein